MKITNLYKRVAVSDILVDRAERQRRVVDTSDIDESIRKRGVIQPIIVDRELRLIAGERRLAASKKVGLPDIPVRFVDELAEDERQLIELEENIKRQELHWRDEVAAYGRLHGIYLRKDENWTMKQTADEIGVSQSYVSRVLRVFKSLSEDRVINSTGIEAAYNVLSRIDERKITDAMSDLISASHDIVGAKPAPAAPLPPGSPPPLPRPAPPPPPPLESILNVDFLEWVKTYEGPRFNLIHCDFPYGINVFAGEQAGGKVNNTYDDSPDVYWKLIETLCGNLDKIMAPSAHMMFWFSMDFYSQTIAAFQRLAPSLHVQTFPLYWLKSDNMGILPDPKRGPRRIVETALIASREDRLIIRAVSNGYASPTDKAFHTSTKPEPMLRHFFQMFVDENTRLLDPTCGSGSALRAAESLGAKLVIGLERDKEHFESAKTALRSWRLLKTVSKGVA